MAILWYDGSWSDCDDDVAEMLVECLLLPGPGGDGGNPRFRYVQWPENITGVTGMDKGSQAESFVMGKVIRSIRAYLDERSSHGQG